MLRILFVLLVLTATNAWSQSESPTLKRIKEAGTINLGYRVGAAPFSYRGSDGRPTGYSVDLCQRISAAIGRQLKLPGLKVNWVPVTSETRFSAVVEGKIDMECGMATVTMSRQQQVDFSHLIFVDGGNMVVRDDAGLKRPADLAGRKIAVQGGTTTEQILRAAIKAQRIDAEIVRVKSIAEGLARVEDGSVHALAGDRVALATAAANAKDPAKLGMLEQDYSYEPYALVLPRGDPDFRLAVNRELARLFRSGEITGILNYWFGAYGNPSVLLAAFVYLNSFPE